MSLKLDFTCKYCSKIYKNPVSLPCNDALCKEHLKERDVLKKRQITCATCQQSFSLEEDGLARPVKSMHTFLENENYLNNEEKEFKRSIYRSILLLHRFYEEFHQLKSRLESTCHDHFQELCRQIDLHFEQLQLKINEIRIEMIAKTKDFESSYLKQLTKQTDDLLNRNCEIQSLDQESKKLDEAFRDPNISNDAIETMKTKYEEAIAQIQLNQEQIAAININLNSNEFKANLSFDSTSFGLLTLNELSEEKLNSQILSLQQSLDLIKTCEFSPKYKFTLLYRGSRDGFSARDFHSKCDGHANTLTLIKPVNSPNIFGGFTSCAWESIAGKNFKSKSDPNAFLFSLVNKDNRPLKMKVRLDQIRYAVHFNSTYGPIFGGNSSDIEINDYCDVNSLSHSDLGCSYSHPQYPRGSNEAKTFLAGSHNFQVSEIEVYLKKHKNKFFEVFLK